MKELKIGDSYKREKAKTDNAVSIVKIKYDYYEAIKESLELIKTAGLKTQKKKYTLFFPAFLKGLRFLEKYLGFIPIGGQYYVLAVK